MIPTYNQARFIADAVNSALEQSYPDLEVVVGDDASTDNTADILREFSDSRLTCVRHSRNLGRVANYRTLLYEHVTGEYVVNLDGDDYYTDPDFISEAVKLLCTSTSPPLLIVARAATGDGDSEFVSKIPTEPSLPGLQMLKDMPREEYALMHMAVMYPVEEARRNDFYRSPAMSSDWESLYRLLSKGTAIFLNRNVGVWRQFGENETATLDVDRALENLSIWRSIYDEARTAGMRASLAALKMHQCEAYFALRSLMRMSKQGGGGLAKLLVGLGFRYPLGLLLLISNPKSVKQLLQSITAAAKQ